MTTCQVTDPGHVGQNSQPCPCCDGLMPAEAVKVGKWKPFAHRRGKQDTGVAYERIVAMKCPHCDYHQERREVIPENAFLGFARLSGDRG